MVFSNKNFSDYPNKRRYAKYANKRASTSTYLHKKKTYTSTIIDKKEGNTRTHKSGGLIRTVG